MDDELWMADLVEEILTADGHEVETAANGLVALRKIEQRAYDLIVCDVRMPELDGPGLYWELARRQPDLLPRIVFITGTSHDTSLRAFLEQTGAPCVHKPFTVEELRHVMRRLAQSVAKRPLPLPSPAGSDPKPDMPNPCVRRAPQPQREQSSASQPIEGEPI